MMRWLCLLGIAAGGVSGLAGASDCPPASRATESAPLGKANQATVTGLVQKSCEDLRETPARMRALAAEVQEEFSRTHVFNTEKSDLWVRLSNEAAPCFRNTEACESFEVTATREQGWREVRSLFVMGRPPHCEVNWPRMKLDTHVQLFSPTGVGVLVFRKGPTDRFKIPKLLFQKSIECQTENGAPISRTVIFSPDGVYFSDSYLPEGAERTVVGSKKILTSAAPGGVQVTFVSPERMQLEWPGGKRIVIAANGDVVESNWIRVSDFAGGCRSRFGASGKTLTPVVRTK